MSTITEGGLCQDTGASKHSGCRLPGALETCAEGPISRHNRFRQREATARPLLHVSPKLTGQPTQNDVRQHRFSNPREGNDGLHRGRRLVSWQKEYVSLEACLSGSGLWSLLLRRGLNTLGVRAACFVRCVLPAQKRTERKDAQ